ncbi:hypothetical protein BDV35DRAFT_384446 [Aspergillus flavus]|uniref:Uncharacterized protein n=1 Tax=Aspergillus flavus TaxID=5059 RepID=A0A5N6GJE3_ASPFL|nr:hypothetical protein BDV35DRAFT_384446 [Aspergillus flavus]
MRTIHSSLIGGLTVTGLFSFQGEGLGGLGTKVVQLGRILSIVYIIASGLIEKLMPSNYEDITRYSAVKQGASFNYVNTQY